jgi:hypothetical protein
VGVPGKKLKLKGIDENTKPEKIYKADVAP